MTDLLIKNVIYFILFMIYALLSMLAYHKGSEFASSVLSFIAGICLGFIISNSLDYYLNDKK